MASMIRAFFRHARYITTDEPSRLMRVQSYSGVA